VDVSFERWEDFVECCGLVLLGCLGFLLFLGFSGVFPLFTLFSCFGVLFVYFMYAKGCLYAFYKLLCLSKKKNCRFQVLFMGPYFLLLVRALKKVVVSEKSLTFCGQPLHQIVLLVINLWSYLVRGVRRYRWCCSTPLSQVSIKGAQVVPTVLFLSQ
jgi:hypothetical protein